MFYRCYVRSRKKRGAGIGLTRHGKGSKIQLIVNETGLPIASSVASADIGECNMVSATLASCPSREMVGTLTADRAYDSDPLSIHLSQHNILLLAPHRKNRVRPPRDMPGLQTSYPKRYIVERTFSWLQRFRRITCRYEVKLTNFTALTQLACAIIILRRITG